MTPFTLCKSMVLLLCKSLDERPGRTHGFSRPLDSWRNMSSSPQTLADSARNMSSSPRAHDCKKRLSAQNLEHECCTSKLAHLSTHPESRHLPTSGMGAMQSVVVVVVALVLGLATFDLACRPFMKSGRSALFRSLDPDYDPDNEESATLSYAKAPPSVKKEE